VSEQQGPRFPLRFEEHEIFHDDMIRTKAVAEIPPTFVLMPSSVRIVIGCGRCAAVHQEGEEGSPSLCVIESRWVPKPLAFAGQLRPRRLNRSIEGEEGSPTKPAADDAALVPADDSGIAGSGAAV
jgi:hypothetical protein